LAILRKTYGFNKKSDFISRKQLKELTGIERAHISRTKKKLLERNMIICNSGSIGIQKDYERWGVPKQVPPKIMPKQVQGGTQTGTGGYPNRHRGVPKQAPGGTQTGTKGVPKQAPSERVYKVFKENIKETNTKDIWDFYLKTFKGIYEPRKLTKKIKKKIGTRLKEYSVDEIKEALINMRDNEFLCGNNNNGMVYANPEYCFRNDEIIEKWLDINLQKNEIQYRDFDKE